MEDACRPYLHRGGCHVCADTHTACLAKDYADTVVIKVMVDSTCGVGASTDACHEIVWIFTPCLLEQLPLYLLRYDTLQAGNHLRVWMGAYCGAYDIECVRRMATPVAYGLVRGVLESLVATLDGGHCGS